MIYDLNQEIPKSWYISDACIPLFPTVIKSKLSSDICICYDSCSILSFYDLRAPGQEYIALHSIDDVIGSAQLFHQVALQLAPFLPPQWFSTSFFQINAQLRMKERVAGTVYLSKKKEKLHHPYYTHVLFSLTDLSWAMSLYIFSLSMCTFSFSGYNSCIYYFFPSDSSLTDSETTI